MYQVIKRDGAIADFDLKKVSVAITKAFDATNKQYVPAIIELLSLRVTADFEDKIEKSVSFLLEGRVDYEFRTTVVKEFNDEESFKGIAEWIKGAKKYFLQAFKDSGDLIDESVHGLSRDEMLALLPVFDKKVGKVEIRGMD